MTPKELITKYKIMLETVREVIKTGDKKSIKSAEVAERFLKDILADLDSLMQLPEREINEEDVKRWFQLLVGRGWDVAKEDINKTFTQHSEQPKPIKISWNDVKLKLMEFHDIKQFTEIWAIDVDFGYWLIEQFKINPLVSDQVEPDLTVNMTVGAEIAPTQTEHDRIFREELGRRWPDYDTLERAWNNCSNIHQFLGQVKVELLKPEGGK